MTYIPDEALDKVAKAIRIVNTSPLDQHFTEDPLVDETNLLADTYYYPSADGQVLGPDRYASIAGSVSGGVTVTFEASQKDTGGFYDVTPAGYDAITNADGEASYVDKDFWIDYDGIRARKFRIKVVTSDATNVVTMDWKLTTI